MVRETYEQFVADRDEDTFGGDIVAVASPATTIVLAYLLVTVLVGGAVGALLYQNPTLFGDQGYARIAGIVVLGLTVIGALRLAIKYVVLLRTKYVVSEDSVRREYQLAYREESRELPLHMIRGVELSKSRLQAFLGYATISFLSVGSNRGIGYVEFDNAANPDTLQHAVLELLEKQRDQAAAGSGRATEPDAADRAPVDGDRTTHTATDDAPAGRDDEPLASSDDDPTASTTGADGAGEDTGDPLADDSTDENPRRAVSGNDDGQEPDAGRPDD